MAEGPLRIVILGGGTAGWMAANLFAKAWPGKAEVRLIESADIGIVGVGEGSTPQLKAFFDHLGISEAEWMPKANATYKVGIGFRGWSERPGYDSYFHPFPTRLDVHTAPVFLANTWARRHHRDVWSHPDRFFLPAALAANRQGPHAGESFPFEIGYGYHFDAALIGIVLRTHAESLAVRRLDRKIVEVATGADGNVTHLVAEGGERIEGDLFVDCSGFRSVIAQQALGVRFLSFADNLFNDRAVVMPTPVDPDGTDSSTTSTALSNGWAWRIPLRNRIGNGYVYSSRYTTPEAAEAELRAYLGLGEDGPEARHLEMKVGRVENSWTGNCLAVGLAQGFIEPLEATALHIVQATVEGFIQAFEAGRFTPAHRDACNRSINARYEGVRDYIVCHYRVNRRTDTPYWRDNAAHDDLSDSLKAILTCWFTGGDLEAEIARQDIARYYAPISWHCLLAGYGNFPDDGKIRPAPPGAAVRDMDAIDDFVRRCALNFPDHREMLANMGDCG